MGWEGLEEGRGGKGGKKEGRVFSDLPLEFSGSGGQDASESCKSQGMRDAAFTTSAVAWALSVGAAILSSSCFWLWE